MISVFDALSSIDQASKGLRSDEDRLDRIIETATAEMARLRAEQADLFRQLARIRMDALRQNHVIGTLDDAEQRALAAIEEQKTKLEALAKHRETVSAGLAKAQEDRTAKAKAVVDAADAIAALTDATEKRMAGDVDWQAQAAHLSGAQARAEAADTKAAQSEADRDGKSKPYLADPLFVYLWGRGYGTSAYRAGPIVRLGDGYVARVVNYEPARRNYFGLTEIPKRLRDHAERLKAMVAEEDAKLEALERKALEDNGIVALEKAHEDAEAALQETDRRVADLERESAALEEERTALLGESGPWGQSGVLNDLANSMQREDLRVLLREALDTPSEEDERIVRRLQAIEGELAKQQKSAEDARQATVALARKKAELQRSREETRRYERQGGGFSNEKLIGDILGGIIGGVLSSRELRDALRSGYRQGGNPFNLPTRPGGGVFGGSRGPTRRPPSSGGGGFRTGGGF
ncbi:hypothetical protein HDIA_0450 [Hartmannibacter diazotrophicus]|uniref:Uncharacterized protein n=1 Tax=Hartmannibacter diazotrophicus TaxID=1482074 RepID=A0A2C9D2G5_9HYPH|nr:hypothetical protein [Hartmannibacter diazotrophicus]SON53991.1 hypothetical protein HDIA_0450 [Hartmannibacter diazotrophicus]